MAERCPKCGNEDTVSVAASMCGSTRRFCSVCDDDFATDERLCDEAFGALGSLQEYHEGDETVEAWLKNIEEALQRWNLRQK